MSDGRLVASTDKPMTAEPAQHRARRMLGEQVTFKRGHDDGSYLEWLTPRGLAHLATRHREPTAPTTAARPTRDPTPVNPSLGAFDVTADQLPALSARPPGPRGGQLDRG